MTNTNKNLFYLSDLPDYQVAENYSDVRGWNVKDASDRIIGKVDHLLVNKATERVVYLDVEVDDALIEEGHDTYHTPASEGVHEFLNKEGENHLIIPIGMASIDEETKSVKSNQIKSSTFAKAKRFRKGETIDFDFELNAMRHLKGDTTIHSSNAVEDFMIEKSLSILFIMVC
ncbi:MAG: PRC-barrel domain-containing protein [Ignavibacteria bacterium]|nr:PRC-barrel domain-containing protein [Ignavibacteria bacterium]